MKKIIPFAILIIAIFLVKCSNKKSNPNNKSEVNNKIAAQILHLPASGEDTLKVSYFADTVIYIPLETTLESTIRYISQLWANDSIILINCSQNGLLMFKTNGKFVRKIGKYGRGPGEILRILNFDVINDTIYTCSSGRRSFMRYSFDGNFCGENKFNYQPAYFSTTADNKLACYVQEEGKMLVYNKNLQTPDTVIVEYGVSKGRYYYTYGLDVFRTYFQKTSSGLLFTNYLNDTVWNISRDKKEPSFILPVKNKLPWDKQVEYCNGNMNWNDVVKPYIYVYLMPFSSWMFVFQHHWTDNKYDAIYVNNLQTGEFKRFNTSFIYDDIVGKQKFILVYHKFFLSDYLITMTDSYKVLDRLKKNEVKNKDIPTPLWLNQMKSVNEYDNPILAFIKIKKNLQ